MTPLTVGRYTLLHELASGGMASVYLARFQGEAGFVRTVVVKRLHPEFAHDPDFVCMFLDEARLASRIRHPHVVSVLDVVSNSGELMLAMDYVHGLSLSQVMLRTGQQGLPPTIAASVVCGLLFGLHAAHEAKSDKGQPLDIVHRDVSPQNVMLGADGAARVVDFGIASAASRLQSTQAGQIKGKLSYMAPEQIELGQLDRRTDVFAAGIVAWELFSGRRFATGSAEARMNFILNGDFTPPSAHRRNLPPGVDAVVMKALERRKELRYRTAEEMAQALLEVVTPAHAFDVARWLEELAGAELTERAAQLEVVEGLSVDPTLPAPGDVTILDAPRIVSSDDSSSFRVVTRSGDAQAPPASTSAIDGPRRRWGFAAGVGLALAAVVLVAVALSALSRPAPPTPLVAAAAPPPPAAAVEPRPAALAERAEAPSPPTSPITSPPTLAVEDLSLEPAPPSLGRRSAQSARPKPAPSPSASKVADDPCSPPYVLLKGGLKHYKPECF